MSKKILLTGGLGYIGSHTILALKEAGFDVAILDNCLNADREILSVLEEMTGGAPLSFYEGSVLDRDFLQDAFGRYRPDAVLHFAALKSVKESTEDPVSYCRTNISGLLNVLGAMAEVGTKTFVYSSSATVYGETGSLPFQEDAPRSYANPYGFTKLTGEQILEQTATADPGWRIGILRYFNPVGAHPSGQIGENPKGVPNNLMPYIERVALGELPELTIFGDTYPTRDGTGERDYIHVMDLAEGHVLSLQSLFQTGEGHVVNLGTGRGYTVLELLRGFEEASGLTIPHKIGPRREGDTAQSWADVSRAEALLGFKAKRGLADMCASSWAWVQARTGNS